MLGMLRAGLSEPVEPEAGAVPEEPRAMGALEVVLTHVLPVADAARRAAEISAREEELHQKRLSEITAAPPPFRTAQDVARALDVSESYAKKFLSENQERLGIDHEKGKSWKLTEEQFARCKAIKTK